MAGSEEDNTYKEYAILDEPIRTIFSHEMSSRASDECEDIYTELGKNIGKLVARKQLSYGDSFHKSVDIMKILYPVGIQLNQYQDILPMIRIIDKLFRISQGNKGEEDAWQDICGYALLASRKMR